jgi:FtsP/CotA-like multicopper oxidase with cupredoxin domain
MAIDSQPAEPFLARGGRIVLAPGSRIDAFIDATAAPGSASQIILHDGAKPRVVARLLTSTDQPLRPAPLSIPPPLPSNGLPAHLDLKNALRVALPLDASPASPSAWVQPLAFRSTSEPAFRAKRGRTVVLAIGNPTATPQAFRLHGHHFRLLDRLDDGWKPFWLDTLAIDSGQTQRIAFAAEYAGRWLMESVATAWTAPRLVRWYSVE